jgi:dipeptidyl-peptidase 4
VKQGLAKADHIGIYGWSYGGYLSAMCLVRYPDAFQCAVSGAPVTSWDGYVVLFFLNLYLIRSTTNVK